MAPKKQLKGIVLAGGAGSRMYPETRFNSKQFLSVNHKPMLYYPLCTMMDYGCREILIISTPVDLPRIESNFGTGAQWGIHLNYVVQPEPKGLAQAFTLGRDFIGNDDVIMILGDNIFHSPDGHIASRQQVDKNRRAGKATIFGYQVTDPERFGVAEFAKDQKTVISLEEKPAAPKSNYAVVGLYAYPNDVVDRVTDLKPSKRGEYEITGLNEFYLQDKKLCAIKLPTAHYAIDPENPKSSNTLISEHINNVITDPTNNFWLDAGTPDSIDHASYFVKQMQNFNGIGLGYIEQAAFRNGFINRTEYFKLIDAMPKCDYRDYLQHNFLRGNGK